MAPRHPLDTARSSFKSATVWLGKSFLFLEHFPVLMPWFVLGITLYKKTSPFWELPWMGGDSLYSPYVVSLSFTTHFVCSRLPSPSPLRKWLSQSALTPIVLGWNLWELYRETQKRMLAYEFLLLSHSKRMQHVNKPSRIQWSSPRVLNFSWVRNGRIVRHEEPALIIEGDESHWGGQYCVRKAI